MASSISKLISNISEYIEVKFEKLKLTLITRLAKILSAVLSFSLAGFLALFFLFFLSFAFAYLLNDLLASLYWGFFIVAGFYLLLIIIILLLAKNRTLQGWFEGLILKFAEQEDEEDD